MISRRRVGRAAAMWMAGGVAIGWSIAAVYGSAARADQPQGLDVGDRAIDFELPIVGGDGYLSLGDECRQGPVALIVLRGYPGYQCPFCRQQFSSLISRARALAAATHRVILVYPGEQPSLEKRAKQFVGARRIPDPLVIVRDEGMQMVQQWGLRWRETRETAYPAAYVIDRNRVIRWRKISQSHAGRSSVEDILKALRKL